ncbi:sensor histidine kinase [Mitsuaria sp. BK037]|uniref:sensor histidine kinase n=1 Tax=Mitsuaria sp. BK037 TaxID=2587122 RepID=UPI00160A8998|nr:PAS domain-containing protein [Mitsuaria sp. BK037]MBB3280174.1 PAS domain S-box-containing protein [Mitsuaria sp. BK037]
MSPQLPLASPDLDALRALLTARGQDVPGLLAGLWDGPWPAFVLDAKGQVLLTNAQLQGLMGEVSLQGQRLLPSGMAQELRLVDDQGREHLLQAWVHPLEGGLGLALLQDHSTELAARERAERMQSEIDQWLDLCPLPALMHDDQGLLLRFNAAFTALCRRLSPQMPISLHELPPEWRELLHAKAPESGQESHRNALLAPPGDRRRWIRVRARRLSGPWSRPRTLVMLEDRSAEQDLELAQQQLQTLMDTAGVGLATFQPEAGWSRPGTGAPPPSSSGEDAPKQAPSLQGVNREMVEPDSRAEYEKLQLALKQATPTVARYAVRHPEHGLRWLMTRVEIGQLASGQKTTSVLTVDITDHQQAQERNELLQHSLQLQTERERAVLDSVLVGIVTVGRHGIEWMNRSARRMFGGDLPEFAGQPISSVATEAPDHPFRQTHYLDDLPEGQAETFECRVVARDGREFWVVGNAVATMGPDGSRQLTYALLDIERRRQAEAQSLQAQASLHRIIEAAPIAISLHDARTLQVRQINQAAAALAGRPEEELLGASLEALFGGGDEAETIRADMEFALQSSEVLQREYRLTVRGQARIWDARLLHLAGVNDASGELEPEQLLLVASDVTQQRAQEAARLEAAIAQRELLVREVHHRIKNNLQGVAGLLQQIAARRPEVKAVINEAVGQVQAIAQVYGLQVGMSGPLRLRKVVEAVMGSVQRMSGREILVEVDGAMAEQSHRWGLPEAEAIPIALTLNELFTNAVKHGGDAPVRCELRFDPEQVVLRIVNTGRLPPGFDLAQVRGGVSGLGLVRALLPRRSALLGLTQDGEQVVCELSLWPPGVQLLEAL